MAIAQEHLLPQGARIYRFPTERVRRRAQQASTVRRRRGVVLGVVAAGLAGLIWTSAPGATAQPVRTPAHVMVRQGDSLWAIASRFAPPGTDLRAYVDQIEATNRLSGWVQPGTRLRLPK